jgi:hypothetical protein
MAGMAHPLIPSSFGSRTVSGVPRLPPSARSLSANRTGVVLTAAIRGRLLALRHVSRNPLTLLLGGLVASLMAATVIDPGLHGQLVARLSVSWPHLGAGQLWRLPTSSLVQEDPGFVWPIGVLLAVLPAAESRLGTLRALLVYVVCDAASSLLALGALEIIGDQRLASEPNIGSSAGLLGLLAAWIATLGPPRRCRAGWALGAGLLLALVIDPELAAVQHVIAAITGGLLGSSRIHLRRRSSVR